MKTSVILNSTDRELFGTIIRQDTKTQMLSVSDLQQAYELAKFEHGWSQQDVSSIMSGKTFQERVFYLLEKQGVIKTEISVFIEQCSNQGVTSVLKGLGVWKTTGARHTKTVMCNPYIWVLLAMEMNPMIYATVVTWLTDSLIFNRIEAGVKYLPLNDAINKIIDEPNYAKYAMLVNKKVFGRHVTGMRNLASAKELREIIKLEETITKAIEMGWIKDEQSLIEAIENL